MLLHRLLRSLTDNISALLAACHSVSLVFRLLQPRRIVYSTRQIVSLRHRWMQMDRRTHALYQSSQPHKIWLGESCYNSLFWTATRLKYPTRLELPFHTSSTLSHIKVYATAPAVSASVFDSTGSTINIKFANNVRQFDSTNNYQKMVVGSHLATKPNTVTSDNDQLSDAFTSYIVIQAPTNAISPVANVVASKLIGYCDDLTFDLSSVVNSGGRPFTSISALVQDSNGNTNGSLTTTVNQSVQGFLTGQLQFKIGYSSLLPASYVFTFSVTNFLGQTGLSTLNLQKSSTQTIWGLTLTGPSGQVTAGSALQLFSTISTPQQCDNSSQTAFDSQLQYSWTIQWAPVGFDKTIVSGASSAQSTLFIPPYTLTPFSTFVFQFNVSYSQSVVVSDTLTVQTRPDNYMKNYLVPTVKLIPTTISLSTYTPNFAITTAIDQDTITNSQSVLSYIFSSVTDCGDGKTYNALNLMDPAIVSTQYNSSTLKFVTGVLTPGASYCIQLQVTDSQNPTNIGKAQTTFSVRRGPRSGSCGLIGSATGNQTFSEFQIACQHWITDSDSSPIYYSFESYDFNSSTWKTTAPQTINTIYSITLTSGNHSIRAAITDATMAKVYSDSILIYVNATSADNTTLSTYLTAVDTAYQQTSDGVSALQSISSLSKAVSDLGYNTTKDIRYNVLNMTNAILQSGAINVDSSSTGPFIASTLHTFAGSEPLPFDSQSQESILQIVIAAIESTYNNSANSAQCVDSKTATKYYEILSNGVLAGARLSQNNTANIGSRIQSAMHILETCIYKSMACGESPLGVSTTDLNRTVGTTASGLTPQSSFCGFNAPNIHSATGGYSKGSSAQSSCYQYACGQMTSNDTTNFTSSALNITHIGTTRYTLVFYNSTSSGEISVNYANTSSSVIFTMDLDAATQFSLLNASTVPACSFIDPKNGSLSTYGCELISNTTTSITCNCTHLTTFVAVTRPFQKKIGSFKPSAGNTQQIVPVPSTVTQIPSDSSFVNTPYFAFLAPFGGIFVIGLLAFAYVYSKSTKKNTDPSMAQIESAQLNPN